MWQFKVMIATEGSDSGTKLPSDSLAGRRKKHRKVTEEFLQTKEEADGIREVFRTILKTGEAYGPTEYPISKPDGSIGHCLSTIFLVSESADDPTFVCMDVDISDQKRLRDELESSRTKYSSLFHTAPDAIIIMDAETRNIIEVNDGFQILTGFAPEEAEGTSPFELGLWVNPEDRSRYMKLLEENHGSADYEGVFRRKDGSHFIGSLRSSVASLGDKKSLIVLARDVTDRTEAEIQLRNKEERFRSIIEYSSDMIHILSQDGTLLYESPSANRILGFADDEPMAENALEFVHPDDLGHVLASLQQIIEYPELPARIECRVRMGNGEYLYIEAQVRNLLNEPGIQGIVINSRDISDRRLAERRMAQQLERLKALRAIDMAISGSLDLKVTLNVVLSETMTQLKATAAMVRILRPNSCMLEIASEHGGSDYYESGPLHIGSGLAGRAVTENRVLQLESNQPGDMGLELNSQGTGRYLHVAAPLVAKGRANGVLEVWVEKSQVGDAQWFAFLEMLAGQTAIAVDNVMMFEEIQRSNLDLVVAYDATIEGWSKALELRDKETEGHTKRVTELSVALSRQMGLSESELVQVRRGALLHDIGKMGVPDEILLKPDKLTVEEFDKMKKHTEYAHEWLASIPFLRHAIEIPYCHHEKWDGTGYPQGLKEEHIPLTARIFAIVDVWDALTSDRPYKRAMDPDEALAYIVDQSGKHFDPEVVRAFEKLIQPRIAKSKAA